MTTLVGRTMSLAHLLPLQSPDWTFESEVKRML
jgi:hypothetical protein